MADNADQEAVRANKYAVHRFPATYSDRSSIYSVRIPDRFI